MQRPRLATPIFLVRHEAEKNLFGVINKLGQLGFEAFEMGGLYDYDPYEIRKAADRAGLQILMDHVPYQEFEDNVDEVIATRTALGSQYISICKIPSEKYPGGSDFSESLAFINRVAEKTKRAGMTLQYHNHGFDFMSRTKGRYPIEYILDGVSPELLQYTPDIGWCLLGGGDPIYMLEKYSERCKIIHLKDYYAEGPVRIKTAHELKGKKGEAAYYNFEFRPTGYGIVNFPGMMKQILNCEPKWLTTDHDGSYCNQEYAELKISREFTENLLKMYSFDE